MERQLSKPETEEEGKKCENRKTALEESQECKKTQAQRLFEFEMWNDDKTLKDLEYSQRRAEKKQRQQERRKAAHNRRWKKLYLPATLAMVVGTVLTLSGTLRSVGGDSVFWEARDVVIIVGPVVLILGFLCLMLAAGCTFEHDQHHKEEVNDPFAEYLLHSFEDKAKFRLSRPPLALRSVSMDTADLPIPEDLDPNKNYLLARSGWDVGRTGVGRQESGGSTVFLDASNSYASTASWVRFVSASHSPKHSLTRQNSDSNLLTARGDRFTSPRRSLQVDYSEKKDPAGSHSKLQVVCTRSLTSSGYQSASDSTTGTAENQLPKESNTDVVDVVFTSPTLRQASRQVSKDAVLKTLVQKPNLPKPHPVRAEPHHRHYTAVADSGLQPGRAEARGNTVPPTSWNLPNTKPSSSSGGRSAQDRRKVALAAMRDDPDTRRTVSFSSYMETCNLTGTTSLPRASEGKPGFVAGEKTSHAEKPPVALEPIVYTVRGNRCTEV
ncbi:hypothetical protein ACOMHN_041828 [Nucella lapillus]